MVCMALLGIQSWNFMQMMLPYIKSETDCQLLQEDLDRICDWANKWQLRLNASKCENLLISNKHKTVSFNYFVNHSPLSWRFTVKYLGVMFCSNLSRSNHCKYVSAKASKSLNFLCYTLWGATAEAKSMAYKHLVHHPFLEYTCIMWNPHTASNKATLESVQWCAAWWVCGSRWSPSQNQWST